MPPIETLRGFVNSWECDENGHLNVQFYFRFFEDAADHFLARAGLSRDRRLAALVRHVRFHSELHGGHLIRIESHAAPAKAPGRWHLVHRMIEPASGRLAATCLDTYDAPESNALALAEDDIGQECQPRSLPLEPATVPAGPGSAGSMTYSGRFRVDEIGDGGHPRHRAIVARFSDANAHFWESIGVKQPWLEERNYGRVAVEMKVTRAAGAGAGLVHVKSAPRALGGKTVSMRHLVIASDRETVAAIGEVTALLFDRSARKSVALPDEVRAQVEAQLSKTSETLD